MSVQILNNTRDKFTARYTTSSTIGGFSVPDGPVKALYKELDEARNTLRTDWEQYSALTVKRAFPRAGEGTPGTRPKNFQSLGNRAVTTLAAKFALRLFTPGVPFFVLDINEADMSRIETALASVSSQDVDVRQLVQQNLLHDQSVIMDFINTFPLHSFAHKLLVHLIVLGNALVRIPDDGKSGQVINPSNFVVQRDGTDKWTMFIVREYLDPALIKDEKVKNLLLEEIASTTQPQTSTSNGMQPKVGLQAEMYTRVVALGNEKYEVYQETATGVPLYEARTMRMEQIPFVGPFTWELCSGQNYAEGFVSEYADDLSSYEALEQLIVKGAAALAKVTPLINPNSTMRIEDLLNAETGEPVIGLENDVFILDSGGKFRDMSTVVQKQAELGQRIKAAFLMTSSVQRDAERVTAEEFRTLAEDLDESLGGMFSSLSMSLALPILHRFIYILEKKGDLSFFGKMSENFVRPKVVTGIEALGRGHEVRKITEAIELVLAIPGAERELDVGAVIRDILEQKQLPAQKYLLSAEDKQQMQRAQLLQELAVQAAPGVANQVARGSVEQQLQQRAG